MEDLSLHILDIAENSVAAGAREIQILISEDSTRDRLHLEIKDDGEGMKEETKPRFSIPSSPPGQPVASALVCRFWPRQHATAAGTSRSTLHPVRGQLFESSFSSAIRIASRWAMWRRLSERSWPADRS